MCSVISGENIDKFRLHAIKAALRLESVGMRGKVNAAVIARDMLVKAGLKASRDKKILLVEFCDYLKSLEG